jgi:hypothetical protein
LVLSLSACGGGGGSSNSSATVQHELASLSRASNSTQEVETSVRAVTSSSQVFANFSGESTTQIRSGSSSESSNSKGLVVNLLEKSFSARKLITRGEQQVTIPCDNGASLTLTWDYGLKNDVEEPTCDDIEYVSITLKNTQGNDCKLDDYLIDGNKEFVMTIRGYELKTYGQECLPEKAKVSLKGTIKVLSDNGTPEEAFDYNTSIDYSSMNWVYESEEDDYELTSAKYSIVGDMTYYLGDSNSPKAEIEYSLDLSGFGNDTSESFSGYVKLGCYDGWLRFETAEPLQFSEDDEIIGGKILVTAEDGKVEISYSDSGVDITQTIDNQTQTFHYNNPDEIGEELEGVFCTED